jgi:translation initiation factor IF-2
MSQNAATNLSQAMRPPVVVVLGHVDHGKTKLLDTIRQTNVVAGESGGITQHIGAYQATANGKLITFLDTPGHEAFAAIRSRGVKVADIAILVVAADESVKPQTKEAIRIIQEEKIPCIVAINKIDKEGSNPQKVRQDLATENILVEDWGGQVPVVEISARDGKNIEALLDMVLLVAEVAELKEDLMLPSEGVIIESNLDKQRGYVATALVKKGILHVGDWIVVGRTIGKVKSMEDFMGTILKEARPSQPVLITGWSEAPDIGKPFTTTDSKSDAEKLTENTVDLAPLLLFLREQMPANPPMGGKKKVFNVIFKSDVSSSLEAIDSSLKAIQSEEVGLNVLDYGIGNIGETDVKMAVGSKAAIFGFRVGVENSAKKMAEKEGIILSSFDIIYELIEAVRTAMGGMLEAEIKRNVLGKLRVLALFKKDSRSQILGGKVTSGKITRGALVDVIRGAATIKLGKLNQLQQNKEDVSEVREGLECGMRIDITATNQEIKEQDVLEVYEEEKITRSL